MSHCWNKHQPMNYPLYIVDAFVRQGVAGFSGNPAAVVPLPHWPDDNILQAIASENNLSETAFFVAISKGHYHIRWFTPTTEVDLCGHATLTSAWVIHQYLQDESQQLCFTTESAGELSVSNSKDNGLLLELDFPQRSPQPLNDATLRQQLTAMLGQAVVQAGSSRDLLIELENEAAVRNYRPDLSQLATLDWFAVIVTAPAATPGYDFVSRFFAPRQGIAEDPVTGSSFCTLAPYWAERLGKQQLQVWQCSARGGDAGLTLNNDRVRISGRCFPYLAGQISLPF